MGIENPKPTPDIAIVKVLDETVNNSAVLQDDDELAVSLPVGKWKIHCRILSNSATNADLKTNFLSTQNLYGVGYVSGFTTAGGGSLSHANFAGGTALTSDFNTAGFGADALVASFEFIVVVIVACTLTLRWCQTTAQLSDTKVLAGSVLEATKLI